MLLQIVTPPGRCRQCIMKRDYIAGTSLCNTRTIVALASATTTEGDALNKTRILIQSYQMAI